MSESHFDYANCDACGTEVSLSIPFRPFQHMIFRKVNGVGVQEPVYGPTRDLCYPCFRNAVIAEKHKVGVGLAPTHKTSAGVGDKEGTCIEPPEPVPALA